MRTIAPVLLAITAMVAAPGMAQDPKPEVKEGAKEQKAKPEKKICRRINTTGSRRPERICMTKDQWREFNNGN